MKHPLHYLRRIFFFVLIVTVTSCEKEELSEEPLSSDTTENIRPEVKISTKPLAQFMEDDAKFKRSYTKFTSKRKDVQLKEGSDFIVNPSKVTKIEDSGNTTYTVAITKEGTPIGTFDNLVIDVDEDETMQSYILSYIPDANGIVEFTNDSVSFKGTMTVTPIDYDASELLSQRHAFFYITIMYCDVWGTTHLAGSGCTAPYPVTFAIPIGTAGTVASQNNNGITIVGSQSGSNPGFGGGSGGTNTVPHWTEDGDVVEKVNAVIEALKPNVPQKIWLKGETVTFQIFNFLAENQFSDESTDFAKKAVEIMSDNNKLKNPSTPGYLDPLRVYIGDEIPDPYLMHYFSMQCAMIRLNFTPAEEQWCVSNPIKCDAKVYWAALSEMIHLGLDIVGLVPVIGEGADLINGAIYLVEGDAVNASLSLAATIPFVGWTATGSKLVVKVVTNTAGEKALKIIAQGTDEIAALASKLKHFTAQVDNAINSIKSGARYVLEGTGAFRQVGGHHPLAKKAFEGDVAYDLKEALSVSADKLNSYTGLNNTHALITGRQNSLYTAWKNANPNKTMSINNMANIEVQAMLDVGIPEDVAKGWVIKALEDLKKQGVSEIKNIPWNGINPN